MLQSPLPICRVTTAVLIVVCLAAAEDSAPPGGPVLGIAFDRSAKALRPLWGVPGSALSGPPIDVGFEISEAQPSGDSAIAVSTQGAVFLLRVKDSAAELIRVHAAPFPARMAISPNAAYAALYYHGQHSITILSLGDEPRVEATAPAPDAADAIAISDTGRALATADNNASGCGSNAHAGAARTPFPVRSGCGAGAGSGVQVMNISTGEWRAIAPRAGASSITFLPATDDIVYADERRGQVVLVRSAFDQPTSRILLEGDSRMNAPAKVAAGADSQIIVTSKDGAVAILDPAGADPAFLDCRCEATRLSRLSGARGVYLLTDFRGGVIWMLDASKPRFLFVPPEKDALSEGSGR